MLLKMFNVISTCGRHLNTLPFIEERYVGRGIRLTQIHTHTPPALVDGNILSRGVKLLLDGQSQVDPRECSSCVGELFLSFLCCVVPLTLILALVPLGWCRIV